MFEVEIETIIKDLNDLDPLCFERGRKKLKKLPSDVGPVLAAHLKRKDIKMKAKGVFLELDWLSDSKEAVNAAALLLETSRDNYFTASCISFLGRAGLKIHLPLVQEFIYHKDHRIQANAIEALGFLGDDSVIEDLYPFLNGPTERIKANTVIALHRLGDKKVLEHLKSLKADEMNRSIQYALGTIGLSVFSDTLNIEGTDKNNSDSLIALGLHFSNIL
jgi:HEAT repeat protein